MRLRMTAVLAAGVLVGFAAPVLAHHSFAMFDQEHPIELVGTVKEFKFTSPHTSVLQRSALLLPRATAGRPRRCPRAPSSR